MKWTNDAMMDGLLADLAVPYSVRDVAVMKLLVAESLKNNARLGEVLIATNVDSLHAAMTTDEPTKIPMPMLVVVERPTGFYILSGNHRAAALVRAGIKTAPMYVVDTDDEYKLDSICRRANAMHGEKQSLEEAKRHALSQMERFNLTLAQACAGWPGLTPAQLGAYRLGVKQQTRASLMGLAVEMDNSHWGRLNRLANDEPFRAAVKLIAKHKLSIAKINEMIGEANSVTSESGQLAAITKFGEGLASLDAPPVGPVRSRPLRTNFRTNLTKLRNFLIKHNPAALAAVQITSASEQQEIVAFVHETIAYLNQLIGGKRVKPSRNKKGPRA